jgi:cytochrome c553
MFCASLGIGLSAATDASADQRRNLQAFADRNGVIATLNVAGRTDRANPFFQSLGSNGRSCATCHQVNQALSLTPAHARRVYEATKGADPLFAAVDGANCDNVAPDDRAGHSLLLQNGLFRIALPVPANAEFAIAVVHDPYGCALKVDPASGELVVSVYRRPLPATNLRFLSAVMFDGRETPAALDSGDTFQTNLRTDLKQQALHATLGHAQASAAPSDAQLDAIVDFELGLYTAQIADLRAGPLNLSGALGGPIDLAAQSYYPAINDVLGQDPTGAAFSPAAMRLFEAWARSARGKGGDNEISHARADIAAGERIFNTFPLTIRGVRGLNDNAALNRPDAIVGTCSTCHDAPNVGDHSLPLPLDIGTSHATLPSTEPDAAIASALAQLSMPDLPVFLVSGCPNPFGGGQAVSFYTTDPARALITGRCSDFNKGKGPILRGLAARAPYFHNGAAADLHELVNFYDRRFKMGLTQQQKDQLVAFLNSL